MNECEGGEEDLELLARFVGWLSEVEQAQDLDDEDDLVIEITDFAARIDLPVGVDSSEGQAEDNFSDGDPAQNRARLARIRVLAELLPRFWTGFGWQEPWRWRMTLDRRGLRPYREIHDVDQLLRYAEREGGAADSGLHPLIVHGDRNIIEIHYDNSAAGAVQASQAEGDMAFEGSAEEPDEIDVLLTILRPEIIEVTRTQLRNGLYDDAIFAAYRRVESALQNKSKLEKAIGDGLVSQAFSGDNPRIKVSVRNEDAKRLVQLFGGAIGLYKGDRSHKDKPALPCRSRRECLRQLANASVLLDLLDRNIDKAPTVRGYDQRGDTLELWVKHASAQAQVWIDDRLCDVVRHGPGSLILDVTRVSAGEHDLVVADGTRTGPVTQVWLTRSPGGVGWQRVVEVSIPLFDGPVGAQRLSATGLRLEVQEDGVTSERIVPTTGSYRVGDYVSSHVETGRQGSETSTGFSGVGPAYIDDGHGGTRRRLWESALLFDGQPYAPVHEPRLMKVTLEPPALLLRPEEKAHVRVLGHYTDGVATWNAPLTDCAVTSENDKIVHVEKGTVRAKGYGRTALRATKDGLYASTEAHVAAHPTDTSADVLTGLPPVAGLAWADGGLIVSARTDELWKLGDDGRYVLAAAVPLQPPLYGGTDTLSAAENGDIAMRLFGHRDVLVLDKGSGYRKSRWASPAEDGTLMAMAWDGTDLILALDTGSICRVHADGSSEQIEVLPERPITSICRSDDALLALTTGVSARLWRIALSPGEEVIEVPHDQEGLTANVVAWLNGTVYFTDFHGGRILRLVGKQIVEVASGLRNPGELAVGPEGSIYVAEFGRGAVRRMLP